MQHSYLRIRDWDRHFENNRTRELKNLSWFPAPNHYDGAAYTELLDHENGPSHYAAWMVIVGIASKCDVRGTLLRRGPGDSKIPHDERSLARVTRIPADVFAEAIPRLIALGWIERIRLLEGYLPEIPQDDATLPQGDAIQSQDGDVQVAPRVRGRACAGVRAEGKEGKEGKEQNGREGKGTGRAAVAAGDVKFPAALDVPEVHDAVERWLRHKQQIGKPYKSSDTASMMFGDFARAGPSAFVAAVNHSIGQNYQGIYAPSGSKNGPGKPSPGKWHDPTATDVGDI